MSNFSKVLSQLNEAKKNKKQEWMTKFEKLAVESGKYKSGKVDWDTATFLFNQGKTPEEATKIK